MAKPTSKEEKEGKEFIDLAFKETATRLRWLDTAERLLDSYQGKYRDAFGGKPAFTFNSFYSLVNLILPNLIFRKPFFRGIPKKSQYVKKFVEGGTEVVDAIKATRKVEGAGNWAYKRINAIEEDKKALLDSFFYGIGICKNGYSYETISAKDQDYVVKDRPFRKRVDPRDFGWHPLATGVDDSVKLAHRLVMPRSAAKEAGIKQADTLKGDLPKHVKEKVEEWGMDPKDFLTLVEVHDQERDLILLYGGEEEELLEKKDRKYKFSGSDFSVLSLAGPNDEFLGIPALAMVEDLALAMNEIFTLSIEHVRKFPAMVFIEEGSIDEDQLEQIRTGEQGSIHVVKDISKIEMTTPLSMGPDYFNFNSLLQAGMDRILGVPDFQRPGQAQSRKSATESLFIQGDANVRRDYLVGLIKNFVLDGFQKIISLQAQFQDKTIYVRGDSELNFEELEFSSEDLKPVLDEGWAWDFDVEEMRADNTEQINNFNNTMNIIGAHPVYQRSLGVLDDQKLMKKWFSLNKMNLDQFRRDDVPEGLFLNPEKENELARKGEPIPGPKRGEPHADHLKEHIKDLRVNGPNVEIIEHISETVILGLKSGELDPDEAQKLTGITLGAPGQPGGVTAVPQGSSPAGATPGPVSGPPGPTGPAQAERPIAQGRPPLGEDSQV